MWFLLFFIVIPFIFFIGFYLFSVITIFITNKIFHKQYSQSLSLILPCLSLFFYLMLIMGGISFKGIDPQYYEFKKLCEKAGRIVFDEKLYKSYKSIKWKSIKPQDKQINTRIIEFSRGINYFDNKIIAIHKGFIYKEKGLWLRGDEAAGWHWETMQEIGCKENNNFKVLGNNYE